MVRTIRRGELASGKEEAGKGVGVGVGWLEPIVFVWGLRF